MSPEEMFAALAAPFPPDKVSWRVGTSNKKKRQRETNDNTAKATKGQVLAYVDARDVMDRLDEVCGPANWQDRYPHVDKKTVCEIDIHVEGRGWVTKADGAGDSDIEAEKGALSDAFKRAAVRWGIGRYLYHLPTPWVDLDDREQIPANERAKLEAILTRAAPTVATRPREPAPPPTSGANAPSAAKPTLAERSRALEATMRKVKTPADLRKAWDLASGLCAALDTADPDRLAALEALYASLFETLTDAAPPKRDDFGLSGDNVPNFN